MRGVAASLAVIVLILIGLGLKAIFVSSDRANSEAVSSSMSPGISAYELQVNHPDVKNLPKQDAPSP